MTARDWRRVLTLYRAALAHGVDDAWAWALRTEGWPRRGA